MPPLQPSCIVPAYGERRDAVQRRLDRKNRAHKSAVAVGTIAVSTLFQGNRVFLAEWSDRCAAKRGDVAEAAQRTAQIAGDGTHIGAFAAIADKPRQIGRRAFHDLKLEDRHLPRLELDRLAIAREVVGASPSTLMAE